MSDHSPKYSVPSARELGALMEKTHPGITATLLVQEERQKVAFKLQKQVDELREKIRELKAVPPPQLPPEEALIMDNLLEAWHSFMKMPETMQGEHKDFRDHIVALQRILMSRPLQVKYNAEVKSLSTN